MHITYYLGSALGITGAGYALVSYALNAHRDGKKLQSWREVANKLRLVGVTESDENGPVYTPVTTPQQLEQFIEQMKKELEHLPLDSELIARHFSDGGVP